HRDHQYRPEPARLGQAESEEQRCVDEIAHAVQPELTALRRPPRQPLGQLVVVENVEQAERELNGDQGPEHGRGHDLTSRKIAIWRRSSPNRGWKICSVKLNLPSGSSA